MRLQFESNLDHQQDAISAVCDLFRGQETCRTEFTTYPAFSRIGCPDFRKARSASETGFSYRTTRCWPTCGACNCATVCSRRNRFNPATSRWRWRPAPARPTFTCGTIFELNRRYGFTKFAVVVPSVAIREGVDKSLDVMGPHLRALYSGTPFEHFVYDSTKLGQVRNFAASPQVQIMVVTVGAINKRDVNSIYQPNEKTGGEKPVDLVRATNPVLIVDEPQSVDGGLKGQGRQALAMMNPLCTLRYSATHAHGHHMVYRLDAVGRLGAQAGQADRGGRRGGRGRSQPALRPAGGHAAAARGHLGRSRSRRRGAGGRRAASDVEVDRRGRTGTEDAPGGVPGAPNRRNPRRTG